MTHGLTIHEIATGARAIKTASTSVIGIVCVAEDADDDYFPLDTAVLVTSVREAIGKAGVSDPDNTLLPSLEAIADQCSPIIVVVRVALGEDDAETATNIIGTTTVGGQLTGMQALLNAPTSLGVKPKILGVPAHDTATVIAALVVIANKLRAFAYAKPTGATVANVVTNRATYSSRNLMLIWPDFSDWSGSAVARALGLRAKIDQEIGWHKTLSNVAVEGVTGLSQNVDFDLFSATTMAGVLNEADITTLIQYQGFRFWGNHTTSDDPNYLFESASRTNNVLKETIAEGIFFMIDKPITAVWVKDVLDTINAKFRSLKAQGFIQGARAWYDPDVNSATDLALGIPYIDYDFTPCAPAENPNLNIRITDRYYADLAAELAALGS